MCSSVFRYFHVPISVCSGIFLCISVITWCISSNHIRPKTNVLFLISRPTVKKICQLNCNFFFAHDENVCYINLSNQWYGHVECSNGAVKTAFDIQVDGKCGLGRPKMTWEQLTERDCREWKLLAINPHDRHTWRSGVRSAMRAASQLSGRGPTGVDVTPVPAC